MNLYLITFDLNHPDSVKNRESIENTIKEITGWWWHYINVWLVAGNNLALSKVHDALAKLLKLQGNSPQDSLFIIRVYPNEYKGFLPKQAWDWLKKIS